LPALPALPALVAAFALRHALTAGTALHSGTALAALHSGTAGAALSARLHRVLQAGEEGRRGVHDVFLAVGRGRRPNAVDISRLHAERRQQLRHVDGEDYVEFFRGVSGKDVGRGGPAHGFDLSAELLVRNGVELQQGVLALAQVGAVELADLGPDLELG